MSARRAFTGVSALMLTGALVAGCTSDAPDPDPDPTDGNGTPTASATPAELTLSVYGDRPTLEAYETLVKTYTSARPEVEIEIELREDTRTTRDQLANSIDVGTPPDLFLLDHDEVPSFVEESLLQPVDLLLEERDVEFADSYQRVGLEAFSAEAALQCMPMDVSPLVVYYNADLLQFSEITPPDEEPLTAETGWNWEEFTLAAESMSARGVRALYVPPELLSLMPLVRSAGADVVDDPRLPTTLTMADGDTREALEQILELVRDPDVTPTRRELKDKSAISRFEDGELGMFFGRRSLVPRLREAEDLRFDVFPLPSLGRFRTMSRMTGMCIAESSPNVEAAADFVAFAASEEGATILARAGAVVPANLLALHSDAFVQPGREPSNSMAFSDGARRSDSSPFAPDWPEVLEQQRALVEKMFYTPVLDLDTLLPRMDRLSARVLAPPEESEDDDSER